MFAERQQRMMDTLNQRRAGMGWQAYLLPAAGLGLLTLLLGALAALYHTFSLIAVVSCSCPSISSKPAPHAAD